MGGTGWWCGHVLGIHDVVLRGLADRCARVMGNGEGWVWHGWVWRWYGWVGEGVCGGGRVLWARVWCGRAGYI